MSPQQCTRGGVKSVYTSHTKPALFVSRIAPVPEYECSAENYLLGGAEPRNLAAIMPTVLEQRAPTARCSDKVGPMKYIMIDLAVRTVLSPMCSNHPSI